MQGQHVDVPHTVPCPRQALAQSGDDVVDLAGAGQENERVAVVLRQGPRRGGGDMGEELLRHPARAEARGAGRWWRPLLRDRVHRAGDTEQRDEGPGPVRAAVAPTAAAAAPGGPAEQLAQAPGLKSRRHRDEDEVLAQPRARVEQEREEEIGVERPLVDLVEDDGAHPRQVRLGLEAAQEEARRDNLDAGARPGAALAPHRVADGPPDLLA